MGDRAQPWVLGIGSSHNGAVCLLRGDEIIVAIQEERLVRCKRAEHPAAYPSLAIEYCLEYAGITARDLSAVGVCGIDVAASRDDVRLNPQLRGIGTSVPVTTITHHRGHAVGALATSGFADAAVLIVDGNGSPWTQLAVDEHQAVLAAQRLRWPATDHAICETVSTYAGSARALVPVEKQCGNRRRLTERTAGMPAFFSLGRLFENIGWQIFGDPLEGPGKVMGLAPYGRSTLPPEAFFDIVDDEILFREDVPDRFRHADRWPERQEEYANLAASVQNALEAALLYLVKRLRDRVPADVLCYAGGVALNSVANERIVRECGYRDVYIMPAAEDSGTSVGAAYHALWELTGARQGRRLVADAVGRRYSTREIRSAVARYDVLSVESPRDVAARAAQLLANHKVIGWFQGGSELGPRALGQRSILADPRRPDIKDVLNSRVKFREAFRPYAPVALLEHVHEWFDVPAAHADSPFMLRVMRFREECRARVPGVVHVDGTGRVQTVARDANPLLHRLLTAFYEHTGVPILLNTSFNTAGEPIVETPEDALHCLFSGDLDGCVLEDVIVTKPVERQAVMEWPVSVSCEWFSTEFSVEPGRTTWTLRPAERPFFRSACEGRMADLHAIANRHRVDHVRFVVDGRWGSVIHFVSADMLALLTLADGRRTGWELFEAVRGEEPQLTVSVFRRRLAQLVRVGALTCRPIPVSLPSSISV